MTRKKRQHTATTHIRTHKLFSQCGRPLLSPPVKHETHHAHISLHTDPIPYSNPNHYTQSQFHAFKCFSLPPQSALYTHNKPNTQSLHEMVFTPPQTLHAARRERTQAYHKWIPNDCRFGPQLETQNPSKLFDGKNYWNLYWCSILFVFIRCGIALALRCIVGVVTCGPAECRLDSVETFSLYTVSFLLPNRRP